jgi:hypothetical protein
VAHAADRAPRLVDAGVGVYGFLLNLYPRQFRAGYGNELLDDFAEGSADALAAGGRAALVRWWGRALVDLAATLPVQWLRTPWIPVLSAAAVIASTVFVGVWGRGKHAFVAAGGARVEDSPQLLLLLALVAMVPVAGTIAVWAMARLIQYVVTDRRLALSDRRESKGLALSDQRESKGV